MTKRPWTPLDEGWDAIKCPSCGRWVSQAACGPKVFEQRTHSQINWDKLGRFYYSARANHDVFMCYVRRSVPRMDRKVWDKLSKTYKARGANNDRM